MSIELRSIDQLWHEAALRFAEHTEKNLVLKPPKSLDDVKIEIERFNVTAPSELQSSSQATKEIGLSLLYLLKLIGGVAAKGASQVFGSADLCFNAVSLLLDIPSKVAEFHKTIHGLFGEVYDALTRFKIYERIEKFSSLDSELIHAAHEVMISFVDICALTISLNSGGKLKRIKRDAKWILFDNDSGVKRELDRFRAHTKTQGDVERTLTLEHVMKSEQSLKDILFETYESRRVLNHISVQVQKFSEGEDSRKLRQRQQEDLDRIDEALSIKNVMSKLKSELSDLLDKRTHNTGGWLYETPEYNDWASPSVAARPTLLILGEENCGKSVLFSTIIEELRGETSNATLGLSPTKTAFFFISNQNEREDKTSTRAETVLRALIYQIAELDPGFRQKLTVHLRAAENLRIKDMTCVELWQKVFHGCRTKGNRYLLLVDGIDQLTEYDQRQLLQSLVEAPASSTTDTDKTTRVLLSGSSEGFRDPAWHRHPRIEIENHNAPDIKAYIEERLASKKLLRGQDIRSKELSELIHDRLPGKAKNNYAKILRALDKIDDIVEHGGTIQEVEEAIDDAGQSIEAMVAKDIQDLEGRLNTGEVEELNELLAWIICAQFTPTIEQLEAVLYLKFGPALKPLQQKIRGKYAKIFISDGKYVWVSHEVAKKVQTPKRSVEIDDEAPQITATIKITKADTAVVQKFLWSLSQKAMFMEFPFDASTLMTGGKHKIQINWFESQVLIVKQSLKLLSNELDTNTAELVGSAVRYLPLHLHQLYESSKDDLLSRADRETIVKGIVTLFTDEDIIEQFWTFGDARFATWSNILPFWTWIQADDTDQYLERRDKRRLASIRQESDPKQALLTHIAKSIAKLWLRDRKNRTYGLFVTLHRYLQAMGNTNVTDIDTAINNEEEKGDVVEIELDEEDRDRDRDEDEDGASDPKNIEKAAAWAKSVLSVQEEDSLWFERLGSTYLSCYHSEASITHSRRGKAIDPSNWRCLITLGDGIIAKAKAASPKNDPQLMREALNELSAASNLLRAKKDDPDIRSVLTRNILIVAELHGLLLNRETTLELYEEALQLDADSSLVRICMLQCVLATGLDDRAEEFILTCGQQNFRELQVSWLTNILWIMVLHYDDGVLWSFVDFCQRRHLLPLLFEHLQETWKSEESSPATKALMMLYGGMIHYKCCRQGERDIELALDLWQQCNDSPGADSNIRSGAVELICGHHFQMARSSSQPGPHLDHLREMVACSSVEVSDEAYYPPCLVTWLVRSGSRDEARELLRPYIHQALTYLSDADDTNDHMGHHRLEVAFRRSYEDANALTAWSLYPPTDLGFLAHLADLPELRKTRGIRKLVNMVGSQLQPETTLRELLSAMADRAEAYLMEPQSCLEIRAAIQKELDKADETKLAVRLDALKRQPRSGQVGPYTCDGNCGTGWYYADNFYTCRYCADVQFCPACLEKLKAKRLKTFMCHADHEWLYVPPWDDRNFTDLALGKVWVGGEVKDGYRTGGTQIDTKDWIESLRKEWGFSIPLHNSNGSVLDERMA